MRFFCLPFARIPIEYWGWSQCVSLAKTHHWSFSRRIIISETFGNIPKVSESLGDRSLNYIIFTHGFILVMSLKVILVHKMTFLIVNSIRNDAVKRVISETSESFGMFRIVSKAITLRENGYCHVRTQIGHDLQHDLFGSAEFFD